VPDVVSFVANGSSVVALGVAIVRYGPFDIEVVLARSVVYALLTGGLVGQSSVPMSLRAYSGCSPPPVRAGARAGRSPS
jgi:hypothetical protein